VAVPGVKTYATAMICGAAAPVVVAAILAQRAGRKRVTIQARRLMKNLGPQVERVSDERNRWRSELALGEIIEWALNSPALNSRPK
jgi:hypothetical protein